MKSIYLVTRTDDVGYDEYDSFVCYASTKEEALNMEPTGGPPEYHGFPWSKDVTARLVGLTYQNVENSVILASFNAG